jgi:hypothetical protein
LSFELKEMLYGFRYLKLKITLCLAAEHARILRLNWQTYPWEEHTLINNVENT